MNTSTKTLPFPMHGTNWNSTDDLFRVAIYKNQNQVNLTFDDTLAYRIGLFANDTLIAANYGCDTERQWLDVGSADNGQYLGKLKNTSEPATLPLMVRGPAKKAGLNPTPHSYASCGGEIVGSKARVYLPPTFSALAANTNMKVNKDAPARTPHQEMAEKTTEELLEGFRNYRLALANREVNLVIDDFGVIKFQSTYKA
jgi:hypothetical protein